jgi:hypothetical protein
LRWKRSANSFVVAESDHDQASWAPARNPDSDYPQKCCGAE